MRSLNVISRAAISADIARFALDPIGGAQQRAQETFRPGGMASPIAVHVVVVNCHSAQRCRCGAEALLRPASSPT